MPDLPEPDKHSCQDVDLAAFEIIDLAAAEADLDPEPEPLGQHPVIDIYDCADVYRRLNEDAGDGNLWNTEDTSRSNEEEQWRRHLKNLVRSPRAGRRMLMTGNEAMVQRIEALKQASPQFHQVVDLILRAIHLSMAAGSPLRLPAMLLLGGPGIGKTYFARRLAEALQTHYEHVSMDMLSERGTLTGLSLSWKGARPGRIVNALLTSLTASPVIVLDEADKVSAIHSEEKPLTFLHSVLEPENAVHYADEYLTIPVRAEHIVWILTANGADGFDAPIRDRLLVFNIEQPTREQSFAILRSIYAAANLLYKGHFDEQPDPRVLDALAEASPRLARKLIELAFGFAHQRGRASVTVQDIEQARELVETDQRCKPFGFLPESPQSRSASC